MEPHAMSIESSGKNFSERYCFIRVHTIKSIKASKTRQCCINQSRMMRNTRAIIEVQFNWIFVLIAGMVIFLFIISLIMSQKKHAEELINIDLVKKITTTLRGKQQLSNTYNEVDIPDIKIYFNCDNETDTAEFRLEGSPMRERLPLEIIFASESFSSNMMQIWTQDFSVPFTVTRFMYISNPSQIFIIYAPPSNPPSPSSAYAMMLFKELPANITKKEADNVADIGALSSGFSTVKIICFGNDCSSLNSYDHIRVDPSSKGLFSYGKVVFHKKPSINNNMTYITAAGLFGAIFSDDAEYYDCQMKRALSQFEIKRSLQYQRLLMIQPEIHANNSECEPVLASPLLTLKDLGGYGLNDSAYIYAGMMKLEINNKDLVFKGCPLVY